MGKALWPPSKMNSEMGGLGVSDAGGFAAGPTGSRSHKDVVGWKVEVEKAGGHTATAIKPEWKDSWLTNIGIWQHGGWGMCQLHIPTTEQMLLNIACCELNFSI